jgi:hypothetical protein
VVPTYAGTVPPINGNTLAAVVTVPPQLVVALDGLAKFKPAGKLSVQAGGAEESVNANEFELYIVTLRVEVPLPEWISAKNSYSFALE